MKGSRRGFETDGQVNKRHTAATGRHHMDSSSEVFQPYNASAGGVASPPAAVIPTAKVSTFNTDETLDSLSNIQDFVGQYENCPWAPLDSAVTYTPVQAPAQVTALLQQLLAA
jgi:hypothetical protein